MNQEMDPNPDRAILGVTSMVLNIWRPVCFPYCETYPISDTTSQGFFGNNILLIQSFYIYTVQYYLYIRSWLWESPFYALF